VPREWQVEWNQLWQPTAEEMSRTRLATAQADQIYYSIGAMSVGEIRTRLEADGEIGDANEVVPPPPNEVLTGSPPGGSGALATADEEGDNLVGQPSNEPVPNDLISVREAAQKFGVPTRTLSKLTEEGALSFWQFGLRKQVSLREVAMLGRNTSTGPRSPGAPEDASRIDRAGEEGLGQGFPKARAEAYEAQLGRMNTIAMKVAAAKVIPAVASGNDGAVDDAIGAVQSEVDRTFGDDVVEGFAEEQGEGLTAEHGAVFFAALGLALGRDIVGGDGEDVGLSRGPILPPPGSVGAAAAAGEPAATGAIGVRLNVQPQLFASEFTAESVELIGVLRSGIKEGLSDAIVRAKQFGGTPEETADRLLKQWTKNGVPSQIPIDRIKKNGERVLISTEKHARLVAHDQINKLNGRLNQTRQEAAGITSFVWQTQNDDRVRPEHAEIEGQTFLWAEGAPGVGLPGEPVNCRCHAAPVIDKDQILSSEDFVALE
jgi:SPP1 gp7 family putative phage head morphogenesis protein/excisionase family DNA binding protein